MLSTAVFRWTQTLEGKKIAETSIQRDVDCFLKSYVPSRNTRASIAEDTLDCPLIDLGLIQLSTDSRTYHFRRGPQDDLPDGILLFATLRFWESFGAKTESLSISDLARQPGSPGRLFKIDKSSLIGRYEQVERMTEGALSYNETAGLKQLFRRPRIIPLDAFDLLEWTYGDQCIITGGPSR